MDKYVPVFTFKLVNVNPDRISSTARLVGQTGNDLRYSPKSELPDVEMTWQFDYGAEDSSGIRASLEKAGFKLEISYKGHGIKFGR